MNTYIKKEILGYYFKPSTPLTEDNCDILGSTFQDFLDGKFVPLTEEQISFAEANPGASIKEIFNMQLDPIITYTRTIEIAKDQKRHLIEIHDTSKEVNSFFLNGMQVWLDKSTRVGLMNSLTIEKNTGKTESTLWFNNIQIKINCDLAIQMLSLLELYALECYNVTAEHKVNVEQLGSIEEIDNYDYTIGYPEKLTFNIE